MEIGSQPFIKWPEPLAPAAPEKIQRTIIVITKIMVMTPMNACTRLKACLWAAWESVLRKIPETMIDTLVTIFARIDEIIASWKRY